MKLLNKRKDENGVSLLEAIIGLGLFAIMITAVVLLYFGGQNFSTSSDLSLSAIEITQASLEGVRSIRDVDWDFLIPGTHGLQFTNNRWSLILNSPDTVEGFTRTITIANETGVGASDDIRIVTVDISWDTAFGGASTSVEFTEKLSRWKEILNEDFVTGDWSNPTVTETYSFTGEDIVGMDVATRKTQAYLVTRSDQQLDSDFFVFDVSDPANIILTGDLDVSQDGLNSIFVKGGYAYVIDDEDSEFTIIDVLDPTNPTIVGKTTPSGDEGESVFVRGAYAYVGTKNEDLYILDVSDPTNPNVLGTYEAIKDVHAIDASTDVAYLAPDDHKTLETIDISNPLTPTQYGYYEAEGSSEKGRSLHYKAPSRVFVGRDNGGDHDNHHEFLALDATDPTDIKLWDSIDLIQTTVNDLRVASGSYAFLATKDENESDGRFIVIDVSDVANLSETANIDISAEVMGIDFYRNHVFLAVNDETALQIITSGP